MARELYSFAVSIPTGTTPATPFTQALTLPVRIVRRIDWQVPPGPAGMMGFALAMAGQNIIPVNAGGWIITDNQAETWDLDDYLDSGAWQLVGYNTGLFAHTVFVRFHVDLVQSGPADTAPGAISADLLSPMTADDLAAFTAGQLTPEAVAATATALAHDETLSDVLNNPGTITLPAAPVRPFPQVRVQ